MESFRKDAEYPVVTTVSPSEHQHDVVSHLVTATWNHSSHPKIETQNNHSTLNFALSFK